MCLGIVFQYCVLLQRLFCELLGWYQVYFVLMYRIRIRNIARLVLHNFNVPRSKAGLVPDIRLLLILVRF